VSHNNWDIDGIFLSTIAAAMAMIFGIAAAIWGHNSCYTKTLHQSLE